MSTTTKLFKVRRQIDTRLSTRLKRSMEGKLVFVTCNSDQAISRNQALNSAQAHVKLAFRIVPDSLDASRQLVDS